MRVGDPDSAKGSPHWDEIGREYPQHGKRYIDQDYNIRDSKGRIIDQVPDKIRRKLQDQLDKYRNNPDTKKAPNQKGPKKKCVPLPDLSPLYLPVPTPEEVWTAAKVGTGLVLIWEGLKWGAGWLAAPESGGLSLLGAALLP
jgi:hypothetical protein